ncbi:phage holin family protein [Pirellulaceae bacterium SH467]|jgi:hypothetical protein
MSSTYQRSPSPLSGLVRSSAQLAGDLLEMGELHWELARQDSKEACRRAIAPMALIALGMAGSIAGLPLLGMAVASVLMEQADWSPWAAYLVSGSGMMLLSIVLAGLGGWGLSRSLRTFSRSTHELSKNLAWLKSLARETSTSE